MMLSEDNQRQSRSELQTLISQMNKSKPVKVKRTPRFRFRALVRTVMNNLKWLTEEESASVQSAIALKGPRLTRRLKGLLRTDVVDRSPEDKLHIFRIIGNQSTLQRYPERVRQNLTASSLFAYYGPGRVLVKEGHPSVAMYFIVSGEARVTKMIFDAGENRIKPMVVATMTAGDSFGEVNILHDEPWPTTVTTTTHIELLRVLKTDFQKTLEEFLGEQREEITRCLGEFPYFKDWTSRTILECCILSRIQKFPKDTLILGDKVGNVANSYFIVSGECIVMHHLVAQMSDSMDLTEAKIHKTTVKMNQDTFPLSGLLRGVERPRLRKIGEPHIIHLIVHQTLDKLIDDLPLRRSGESVEGRSKEINLQSLFFRIALLMPGQCFGIGECLEDKFILSNSDPVVLLEIPRYFLKLHNRGNIWGRVREFFNLTYPSPKMIFRKFVMERKWQMCRKRYLESILKANRPFTGLTIAEQPYYYRLFEDILNPMFSRVKKTRIRESSNSD